MPNVLVLQSVCKTFHHATSPVRAVDDISLEIRENEFFTLLGPSGCGKTTLLRMIAGLETVDSGRILLDGQDIAKQPAHRRPVNTVFQNYALFPHMSVRDNISFGLRMQGKSEDKIAQEVTRALCLIRLEDLCGRKPAELSGGQQQRVALARALVNHPKILLLDESLSALDYKLRKDMQLELKRLQRDTGITFIFVTHDQDEALSMSDRIAVLEKGRIAQLGTPQEIYEHPASRFVADFIGICNFLPAKAFGLAGDEQLGFRPEDATLGAATAADTVQTQGTLTHISYRGAVTHYAVCTDAGITVTLALDERTPAVLNDRVTVTVPRDRLIRCDG